MNIAFIHIVEIIVLLLVIGKVWQISRLYKKSAAHSAAKAKARTQARQQARDKLFAQEKAKSRQQHQKLPKNEIPTSQLLRFKQNSSNFSFNDLPLPEVTFSGNRAEKVTKLNETRTKKVVPVTVAEKSKDSVNKTILNNYIDDFFFEESPNQMFQDMLSTEVVEERSVSVQEDDFITVAEDAAEMVRAFQSSNQKLMLVR